MSSVAFLGTGEMGSRIVRNLLAAGHRVTVWNRTPERAAPLAEAGARLATTPRQAASGAEVVISMVRDDDAARAVWLGDDGALLGLRPGAVAAETSTTTPAWTRELAERVASRGAHPLDAPVVGSRPQAEARGLVCLVGGSPMAVEQARPVLEAMGARLEHVGASGSGMALKLIVNGLFAVQVGVMAELLGVMARGGLDTARATQILAGLPVTAPAVKAATDAMVRRDFAPAFPIELVAKDMDFLRRLAEGVGARVPVSTAAHGAYEAAIAAGRGGENVTGVAGVYVPA